MYYYPGQNGSNDNEQVLHISQNWSLEFSVMPRNLPFFGAGGGHTPQ